MDVLTSNTGKRNQSGECCEAIDQNFDCGCILKKGYTSLHLLASPNNYWLKRAALEQLKNMHIAWATCILAPDMASQI